MSRLLLLVLLSGFFPFTGVNADQNLSQLDQHKAQKLSPSQVKVELLEKDARKSVEHQVLFQINPADERQLERSESQDNIFAQNLEANQVKAQEAKKSEKRGWRSWLKKQAKKVTTKISSFFSGVAYNVAKLSTDYIKDRVKKVKENGIAVYDIAKLSTAYTASAYTGYHAINIGADLFAAAATPLFGPVVPASVGVLKGVNLVTEYIPGVRVFKHMAFAMMTEDIVLPGLISAAKVGYQYAPEILEESYQVATTISEKISSNTKSIYNGLHSYYPNQLILAKS